MNPNIYQDGMPTTAAGRKACPITRGVLDYFPDAMSAVANCSFVANEQHNPGEPMHWAREKSFDHADCLTRHLMDRGTTDTDGIRHATKVAWRALALLQTELEEAYITKAALDLQVTKQADGNYARNNPPLMPESKYPAWMEGSNK